MNPILFAHLTDTHVNVPGKTPLFSIDGGAKLRAVFAEIGRLSEKPAFIVISGDLTQDGDVEDYKFLRQLIDEEQAALGIPVYVALGNHDSRPFFREGYLNEEPSEESYHYSFMHEELRIIMLNTQVPGKHDGRLDEAQLDWLSNELASTAPAGTIVVLHHPVVATPSELMDSHLLENPEALADVIAGTDVIGLLSGHIHFNSIGLFRNIPSAAGTGVAFGLDPTSKGSMKFIDNSGYNLVLVKNGQMIVTPAAMPGENKVVYEFTMEQMKEAIENH
ncbi:metallophosphoesterase family protein [Paenibacillus sp. JDR-2]|uniref:metallophosphoesterase family protein n=1 Tax=Paenibacillus sp. (strain JDR-2) TaxID=324057 RepID=UPI000166A786|nr:metallophosphoesterase [Paenibacillus sp. JDR-2]ACT00550.1 metallophosphoesterase [Paenibacillus sp. JDR-2]